MTTFEDALKEMQRQTLAVITGWQQATLEAHYAWLKAITPFVPDLNLYHELPTFAQDALGDPEGIFESSYGFAIQVLELHKDLVTQLFKASMIAPRTPFVPRTVAASR